MRFRGKSIIVTGAAGGIGRATAMAFAAEGGDLVLADVKPELHETAALCRAAGVRVEALNLDIGSDAAPDLLVQSALERHGRLDVAFNNAGIVGVNVGIDEYPDDVWDQVFAINVRAIFRSMKAQVRAMRAGGGGAIVNTASVASLCAMRDSSGYIAAKHAVLGLTRAAALDVAGDGIRINAICPGIVDTPLLDHGRQVPGLLEGLTASVPLRRMADAGEIARCVLFLASPEASYMIGQGMVVDGGVTLA